MVNVLFFLRTRPGEMSYNSVERMNFISQTQASKNHIIYFSLNQLESFLRAI